MALRAFPFIIPALVAMLIAANSFCAELPGEQSEWHGFARNDFTHNGRKCILVSPKNAAPGAPWVWRARFFGHEPQADVALLKLGYHIAYCDVGGLFGSPAAVKHWDSFYRMATKEFGLAKKPALEGMSRGGLIIYNWAAANPEKVACLYGDAPVCDFKSWPGGKGKGKGGGGAWQACLKAYGVSEEQALKFPGNPIDNLKPLAEAKIPILHVVGAADVVVPVEENSAIIEERYKKLGGAITVISKPGVGHHPHALKDPKPIVDFVVKHTSPKKPTEKKPAKKAAGLDPKTTYHQGRTLADWEDCLEHKTKYIRWITIARMDEEGPCHPYFVPHLLDLNWNSDERVAIHAVGALSKHAGACGRFCACASGNRRQRSPPGSGRSDHSAGATGLSGAREKSRGSAEDAQRGIAQPANSGSTGSVVARPKTGISWSDAGRHWSSEKAMSAARLYGYIRSLGHFAAQEESFADALDKFVKSHPDRKRHTAEQDIVKEVRKTSGPLIAAKRARSQGRLAEPVGKP